MQQKTGYAAIIGKPNSGKSTLMNVIMGVKLSIVTPKPQTTRKRILGIHSTESTQIIFLDTPGMIKPRYKLQSKMMAHVASSLDQADVIVLLLDAAEYLSEERGFHSSIIDSIKRTGKPAILVLNKTDLLHDKKALLPVIDEMSKTGTFTDIIPISALRADNIDSLLILIEKYLPEMPFLFDPEMLATQPERFFVAEIIREQVFLEFEQEIPYSVEIVIVEFKEREEGKWFISAEIVVDKKSQKGMMIGEKGRKIKLIGEKSRSEIERHLEREVFLELFVKVRENWRNDERMLGSFGYNL
ncbi:MAG: GTP-binding protein Era [Ignavibacteria bacterium]|nr:GTP-binding protein Era [Ignavibacteria bacterium]